MFLAGVAPRLPAQELATPAEIVAGQDLIYRGRFSAAQLYFSRLAEDRPHDPVGPTLAASALIWWAEARNEETFLADSIDELLAEGVDRARRMVEGAATDSLHAAGLFWLGTALGYRARQADLRGSYWRASREARQMRAALEEALAVDSTCVDCLLGLAVYDYALARAGSLARLVARVLGLGGGDAERALERLRRVSDEGGFARTEARWVYANALVREATRDPAHREEARRLVSGLAEQYPDNPVFRRFLNPSGVP